MWSCIRQVKLLAELAVMKRPSETSLPELELDVEPAGALAVVPQQLVLVAS